MRGPLRYLRPMRTGWRRCARASASAQLDPAALRVGRTDRVRALASDRRVDHDARVRGSLALAFASVVSGLCAQRASRRPNVIDRALVWSSAHDDPRPRSRATNTSRPHSARLARECALPHEARERRVTYRSGTQLDARGVSGLRTVTGCEHPAEHDRWPRRPVWSGPPVAGTPAGAGPRCAVNGAGRACQSGVASATGRRPPEGSP